MTAVCFIEITLKSNRSGMEWTKEEPLHVKDHGQSKSYNNSFDFGILKWPLRDSVHRYDGEDMPLEMFQT